MAGNRETAATRARRLALTKLRMLEQRTTPEPWREFVIEIAPNGADCRVYLDGADISSRLRGFEIVARVGEATRLLLDVDAPPLVVVGSPATVDARPDAIRKKLPGRR